MWIRTEASKAHRPWGIPVGIVVLRAVTAISVVVVVPAAVSSSAATATAVASSTTAVSAAALRAADGTGEATILGPRLLETLQFGSLAEIIPGVYGGGLSRVQIAGLSRVVAAAAQDDEDAVARAILMRAGGALAHLAYGVTLHLFAEADAPFPVSTFDGLWDAGNILTDVFARSLQRFAPQSVLIPPRQSLIEGAVRRAAHLRETTEKDCPAS